MLSLCRHDPRQTTVLFPRVRASTLPVLGLPHEERGRNTFPRAATTGRHSPCAHTHPLTHHSLNWQRVLLTELFAADLRVLCGVAEGWHVEYKSRLPNARVLAKSISAGCERFTRVVPQEAGDRQGGVVEEGGQPALRGHQYGGWLFVGVEEKPGEERRLALAGSHAMRTIRLPSPPASGSHTDDSPGRTTGPRQPPQTPLFRPPG